ncbi:MAG TPA: HPr family phosphocarrier protein [Bdellovibrionota bacterium]|nr:HPr family phosphocarrier protein [Bdellovibrionota bacterium]
MEKTVYIKNEEGFHARPAGIFVKKASAFASNIEVKSGEATKNGKSIMGLMSLGLKKDSPLTIIASGADEAAAVAALAELVERKFEE